MRLFKQSLIVRKDDVRDRIDLLAFEVISDIGYTDVYDFSWYGLLVDIGGVRIHDIDLAQAIKIELDKHD